MDNRQLAASRRATIVAQAEAAATDRLITATDAALGRLWGRYSDGELRELSTALTARGPSPIVSRFESDLAHIFGGEHDHTT